MEISVSQNEYLISVASPFYQIDFDVRYSEKQYPILCLIDNLIVNEKMIDEIDSSGIVKVDTEFSSVSYLLNDSTILLIPQLGFSTDKLVDVFRGFLQKFKEEK